MRCREFVKSNISERKIKGVTFYKFFCVVPTCYHRCTQPPSLFLPACAALHRGTIRRRDVRNHECVVLGALHHELHRGSFTRLHVQIGEPRNPSLPLHFLAFLGGVVGDWGHRLIDNRPKEKIGNGDSIPASTLAAPSTGKKVIDNTKADSPPRVH
ncbi:hypothetical protein Salat_1408800 [Sesamum alatum]|uniref:Uncharacterized protein n=1 Tax=Sesamum alatum TaxID=300844 RepID=A0AAE1YAH0_9LAMI|nr:hypothetical protein Salat_1408800 [Sesamum alatum]